MKNLENKLQENCIKWFDYAYPQYRKLLFAIPNGSKRNIQTAMALKRQGVRAGLWDLFLAVPKQGKHGLFIEMKVGKNKLTDLQIEFMSAFEKQCYQGAICYSFDEFRENIDFYLT